MDNNLVARAAVTIDAPSSAVWRALLNPEAIKQYMFGAQVETDWSQWSTIVWRGEWDGKPYEDKGVVLEVSPERRLKYSHYSPRSGLPDLHENYHTVTIDLAGAGQQTRVSLTQDKNSTEESRHHSERNWGMMLAELKRYLER